MGFNSGFKGLNVPSSFLDLICHKQAQQPTSKYHK